MKWLGGERTGVGGVADQKGVSYDDGSHLIGHSTIGSHGRVDLHKKAYRGNEMGYVCGKCNCL